MEPCKVRLYALSTCIHCRNAQEFLTRCGVSYECIEVDKLDEEERKQTLRKIREINISCSFPTIVVGDTVIVGFREDEIKRVLEL